MHFGLMAESCTHHLSVKARAGIQYVPRAAFRGPFYTLRREWYGK